MSRHYELNFEIGKVGCTLITVQPNNAPEKLEGLYFEHYHPCFELHFVERGESRFIIGSSEISLLENDLLLIPPRLYHREIFTSQDNVKMSLTVAISPPCSDMEKGDLQFYSAFNWDKETIVNINNCLPKELLLKIKSLAEKDATYVNRERARLLCASLLIELYELVSTDKENREKLREPRFSEEYVIDTFIALNFKSNSLKEELAKSLNVSPRQLHRIITEKYGKNYREKLIEMRVKIATGLLSSSEKSVAEISEFLGYSSPANFSTFFKKATGKTPSQLRSDKRQ